MWCFSFLVWCISLFCCSIPCNPKAKDWNSTMFVLYNVVRAMEMFIIIMYIYMYSIFDLGGLHTQFFSIMFCFENNILFPEFRIRTGYEVPQATAEYMYLEAIELMWKMTSQYLVLQRSLKVCCFVMFHYPLDLYFSSLEFITSLLIHHSCLNPQIAQL